MQRTLFSILAGSSIVAAWTELSHEPFMTKNIDAIVVPGTYTSHMHTFFGSDATTNVMPTSVDLQEGCYSGDNPNDLSVYWVPTLYHVDGDTYTEVPIFRFTSYYTNSFSELAIPQNFAMISGNASAKTQAEADSPSNDLEWFCEGSDEREADVAKMPTSTCDQHLQSNLVFPNCVNPDNIAEYDFADDANKCPDGMKQIPQLRYRVLYDTKSVAPDGWSGTAPFQLSCSDVPGDGYCYHGDFINGWFEDAAENMLVTGGGGYEDGQFIAGSHGSSAVEASCTPTDQDPENGTSDYEASLEMMANGGTAVVPADSTTWETATVTAAPTTNMDMSGESVTLATLVSELAPTTATSSSEQCTSDAGGRNRGKCQHNPTSSRTIGQRSKRGAAHYSLH